MGNYELSNSPSPEENARIIKQAELRALVTEKHGYETRIAIGKANGKDVSELEGALIDVTAVLEGAGASSQPVARTRK